MGTADTAGASGMAERVSPAAHPTPPSPRPSGATGPDVERPGTGRWRTAVPALLIGGQAVLFLAVYHHLLGGMGSAMAPHLLLAGLGTATLYRLAQTGRQLPWRVARALWLWGLALGTVGATTIFYLTATYCLVWLRDLPTRRMVVGHASQVPALLAALPVDRLTLVLAVGVVSGGVLMLTATVVWGLAGTRRDATPHRCTGGIQPTWWQVGGRLLPGLLLAGLVVMPPHGLLELREPWLRSLHDQPLSVARLGRQDNPVEVARDQRAARGDCGPGISRPGTAGPGAEGCCTDTCSIPRKEAKAPRHLRGRS